MKRLSGGGRAETPEVTDTPYRLPKQVTANVMEGQAGAALCAEALGGPEP
jgi:hypothetical protein